MELVSQWSQREWRAQSAFYPAGGAGTIFPVRSCQVPLLPWEAEKNSWEPHYVCRLRQRRHKVCSLKCALTISCISCNTRWLATWFCSPTNELRMSMRSSIEAIWLKLLHTWCDDLCWMIFAFIISLRTCSLTDGGYAGFLHLMELKHLSRLEMKFTILLIRINHNWVIALGVLYLTYKGAVALMQSTAVTLSYSATQQPG